jgi:hypothetical protein
MEVAQEIRVDTGEKNLENSLNEAAAAAVDTTGAICYCSSAFSRGLQENSLEILWC